MAASDTQYGLLPRSLTTYFNRPSKIIKPSSSRNPSPRNRTGRRMTTNMPARTRSVVDAQRNNVDVRHTHYSRGRPMSWHASLVDDYQQFQSFPPYFQPQQYDMYGNTVVNHGLSTPSSFPVMDQSFMQFPQIPLDHMNNQDLNALQHGFQFANVYADGSETYQFGYPATTTSVFGGDSVGPTMTTWPYPSTDFGHNIPTAPVSPDFLPFPDFGNTFSSAVMEEVIDRDELVGMGLYDSPAEVQSASLLFRGSMPARRKSLKLEESFEPGPLSDEDAESESTQQDDISVVSAEFQTESVTTIPGAHPSIQQQDTDHGIDLAAFEPYMMPAGTAPLYPGASFLRSQHLPGWV